MSDNIRDWDEARWIDEWNQQFPEWSHMHGSAGECLVRAAQALPDGATEVTNEQMREAFIQPFASTGSYYSNPDDDERIYSWLSSLIEEMAPQPEPSEPKNATVNIETIVNQITPALPSICAANRSESTHGEIMRVLQYQFDNWNRGVYKVSSTARAIGQFDRRLRREYGWHLTAYSSIHNQVTHLITYLWRLSEGESPEMVPAMLSSSDIEAVIREEGITYNGSSHYLASAMYRIKRDLPDDEEPTRDDFAARLRAFLSRYFESEHIRENLTDQFTDGAYAVFMSLYFGAGVGAEPVEGVEDREGLFEWMKSLHPEAGSLQIDAIRDGLSDWYDTVRTDPDRVKDEGLVASMRRQVKAYGFTRFSGKKPRSVLSGTLQAVFDKHAGGGLTDEEWRVRWARRDRAVSFVSGRYGEQNDLCRVLEQACGELGVDPMRKPKHKVRFRGSGVVVEVEVESWYDNQDSLNRSAQERWHRMSDEEKEASVVKREGVYVNWSQMQVAR